MNPAGLLRSAARDYTRTEAWLRTDPQMPKSIWWYSDCFNVGFRVVCEFDAKTGNLTTQIKIFTGICLGDVRKLINILVFYETSFLNCNAIKLF